MKRWRRGVTIGIVFLMAVLIVFAIGLSGWFPSRDVKRWIESFNIPGNLAVASVSMDPLLRIRIKGGQWTPERNSYVTAVVFPFIQIRPSWAGLLSGRKEAVLSLAGDTARLSGIARSEKKKIHLSFQTEVPGKFPFPLQFAKGISLAGTWQIEADLTVEPQKTRGAVSGTGRVRVTTVRIRVKSTPLGPVTLSFKKGSFGFSLERSVLVFNKIHFTGDDLAMEGEASLWIDPFTNAMTAKGALYMRPGTGLVASNPRLNQIIRMLPRDARGNKLVF